MTEELVLENTILQELLSIEERDGVIKPEAVVEFAQDPNTALHSKFEWDDSAAAVEYRLWQARHLIRAVVTYIKHEDKDVEVRAFVNIEAMEDREQGYYHIATVLHDQDMRTNMLEAAKRELRYFRKKYADLKELSSVFEAIDNIQ